MVVNYDRYNTRVKDWGKEIILKSRSEASSMGVTHRADSPSKGASLPKLRDKYRVRNAAIEVVSIKFPRALIYTHKGAGKGRGGTVGSTWTNKYGIKKKPNSKSFGKMGGGGRKAKPFFNNVLDNPTYGVEALADIVAEETGDAIVNKMFIK